MGRKQYKKSDNAGVYFDFCMKYHNLKKFPVKWRYILRLATLFTDKPMVSITIEYQFLSTTDIFCWKKTGIFLLESI